MTIDHTTPPPARHSTKPKYGFAEMAPGDCKTFPPEEGYRARKAAHMHGHYHGLKFVSETQPDGSVKVWRVS